MLRKFLNYIYLLVAVIYSVALWTHPVVWEITKFPLNYSEKCFVLSWADALLYFISEIFVLSFIISYLFVLLFGKIKRQGKCYQTFFFALEIKKLCFLSLGVIPLIMFCDAAGYCFWYAKVPQVAFLSEDETEIFVWMSGDGLILKFLFWLVASICLKNVKHLNMARWWGLRLFHAEYFLISVLFSVMCVSNVFLVNLVILGPLFVLGIIIINIVFFLARRQRVKNSYLHYYKGPVFRSSASKYQNCLNRFNTTSLTFITDGGRSIPFSISLDAAAVFTGSGELKKNNLLMVGYDKGYKEGYEVYHGVAPAPRAYKQPADQNSSDLLILERLVDAIMQKNYQELRPRLIERDERKLGEAYQFYKTGYDKGYDDGYEATGIERWGNLRFELKKFISFLSGRPFYIR